MTKWILFPIRPATLCSHQLSALDSNHDVCCLEYIRDMDNEEFDSTENRFHGHRIYVEGSMFPETEARKAVDACGGEWDDEYPEFAVAESPGKVHVMIGRGATWVDFEEFYEIIESVIS